MSIIKNQYTVLVNGTDVTSRFNPLVTSISVERAAGKAADTATIVVANPGGAVFMPQDRDPIEIHLAGVWVFEGFVNEIECSIDKSGGRTISITASSVDQGGKATEPTLRHKDNASFEDTAKEFGKQADLDVTVIGDIAQVQRDYWLMQNESFLSWGRRMEQEIGATFKVLGRRAFFTTRNEGESASGQQLTTIEAAYGFNLLSASIRPIVSRPRFKNVKISYFDTAKGVRVEEEVDTGVGGVETTLRHVLSTATKDQAKQKAKSLGKNSDRDKGQGDINIIGDPRAEPEALCVVSGVMAGADGTYRIDSVSHKVSRSGFTTSLTLKQPQGSAGKDTRLPATAPVPTPRPT